MTRDLREAIRFLVSNPSFSLVVIVTLSLAIGVNTTIFSALNSVILRPLDYREPDGIVMLWENNLDLGINQEVVSAATYIDWRERATSLNSIGLYRHSGFVLETNGEVERVRSLRISPLVFNVLGIDAALGRTFTQLEERPGNERLVILSHGAWERRFGKDPSAIGTSLFLDNEPYEVVGVMPPDFEFPAGEPVEMWTPLTLGLEDLPSRPHRMYNAIARLAPGTTIAAARNEMGTIAAEIAEENPESNAGWGVTMMSAHEFVVGNVSSTIWFLFGAVGLVLLIGCINVTSLLLARSTRSARDLAIRSAFGANGWLLVRRALIESLLLATASGLIGLLLAFWGTGLLRGVMPDTVPRVQDIGVNLKVLGFTAGISLLAGLISGVVPAIRAMSPRLTEILQEGGIGKVSGRRGRWLTSTLVVAEVSLAVMILIGAGLLIRSFVLLTDVDPGFRNKNVVSVVVSLPESRYSFRDQAPFFDALLAEIEAVPNYDQVGLVSTLPMSPVGNDFEIAFTVSGLDAESPSERPRAGYRAVSPGYFQAMGIQLLRGRAFDRFDSEQGHKVIIINEALRKRFFDGVDPIGQMMMGMPMLGDMEIVGVVADVLHSGLGSQPQPEVFVPFTQLPLSEMHVIVHSSEPLTAITNVVKEKVNQIDPQLPITAAARIEDLLANSIAQPRFNMALLTGLALSAVILAAIGIYGMVSYSVASRTGEIGLRMILGASRVGTGSLILREVLVLVSLGLIIGLTGASAMGSVVQTILYGVASTDPVTFIAVSVGIILTGVVAAAAPTARAMRTDPVDTLKA